MTTVKLAKHIEIIQKKGVSVIIPQIEVSLLGENELLVIKQISLFKNYRLKRSSQSLLYSLLKSFTKASSFVIIRFSWLYSSALLVQL